MSNPITCSASSCIYNNAEECHASGIKVYGMSADTTKETTCSTYHEKDPNSFSNSVQEPTVTQTSSISCAATSCKYNDSGDCNAESIHINRNDASCETFVTR